MSQLVRTSARAESRERCSAPGRPPRGRQVPARFTDSAGPLPAALGAARAALPVRGYQPARRRRGARPASVEPSAGARRRGRAAAPAQGHRRPGAVGDTAQPPGPCPVHRRVPDLRCGRKPAVAAVGGFGADQRPVRPAGHGDQDRERPALGARPGPASDPVPARSRLHRLRWPDRPDPHPSGRRGGRRWP
jgi:hypothetical protein